MTICSICRRETNKCDKCEQYLPKGEEVICFNNKHFCCVSCVGDSIDLKIGEIK